MKKYYKLAERLFIISTLLFYSGAIGSFIADDNPLSIIKVILAYTSHSITLFLIVLNWKKVTSIIIKERTIWAVIAIVIASLLWSDLPAVTLEKIMPLLRVTVFGVYLAACYSLREQMLLLAGTFGAAAVLSFLICVGVPSYGVVGAGLVVSQEEVVHAGAWRGIYVHKTILGTMMSLGSLIFLCNAFSYPKYRWIMWAGFCFSFLILLLSTTKAALAILMLTLVIIIPFYRSLRWRYNRLFLLLATILLLGFCVGLGIWANYENTIFSRFGKDITLTGRTDIWPPLIDKIWERPWLGYGYETFWLDEDAEVTWVGKQTYIWRQLVPGFEPPHAHNGILEIWLDVGLIGLTLFLVSYLKTIFRSIIWLRAVKTPEGLVPLTYLTVLMLINLTESMLMRAEILWLCYVTVSLSINRIESYGYNLFLDTAKSLKKDSIKLEIKVNS